MVEVCERARRLLVQRRGQRVERVHRARGAADKNLAARMVRGGHDAPRDVLGIVDGPRRLHRTAGVVGAVLEERRVDGRRHDGHHVDPGADELLAQRLAEADDRELRRRVRRVVRHRHLAEHRGDVDQHAVALCAEMWQRRPGAVHAAEEVRVHDAAEDLRRDVLERPEHANTGVVHPDVDVPEAIERAACQHPHRALLAHVGRHGERLAAARAAVLDDAGQRRLAPRAHHDRRTLAREGHRRRAADAARGARDHDHRFGQISTHDAPPRREPASALPATPCDASAR